MATKKTPPKDDDALAMPGASDSDFDQAVDDLRGVLKADADGGLGEFGSDLGDFGGIKDDPISAAVKQLHRARISAWVISAAPAIWAAVAISAV